jgi:aminoglycoside phosphotransferase family enzyme/predicted kinase
MNVIAQVKELHRPCGRRILGGPDRTQMASGPRYARVRAISEPLENSQEPAFALLSDPASHGGQTVKRIDTHAASVFLAGDRALKVKRAVRFPFLDYSTIEKRKAACEMELSVNRPFAPELYRRVVAITRAPDGTLRIDGDGVPVEWAVDMRRFDENATLDHLAASGRIDAALADTLGRTVAAAHALTPQVEAEPWIAALGEYIEQNDAAFRAMPELFSIADIDALTDASRSAFARLRPLLQERGGLGLIRRGHGDLHLGNIVLIDERPVLFDAIEFSPLIASGDVLYDLAFLLMDLVERGLSAEANILLNRYLAETQRTSDFDALAALPLFLSVRAAIRSKVTAARIERAPPAGQEKVRSAARQYFDFARSFIAPAPPRLVAVGGLSGTGKSLLARALASGIPPAPGAVVLRSDVERKLLLGQDEQAKLPPDAYSPAVTLQVYAGIIDKARRAVAAGHSAIVDAVFATPQERIGVRQSATALGVSFCGLFLTADLAIRRQRVGARRGDASDADAAVVERQEDYDLARLDWPQIDASGTPEQTLERARHAIRPQDA